MPFYSVDNLPSQCYRYESALGEGSRLVIWRGVYASSSRREEIKKTLINWVFKRPFLVYMTSVLFLTAVTSALFALWLTELGVPIVLVVIMILLLFLPLHGTAEIIVCKIIQIFFKPHILPELNFSEGIPDEFKTLIVYASLLSNKNAVSRTLKHMENTHLANKDDNLPIAILTHFKDSLEEEVIEEESELLKYAVSGIDSLNRKYGRCQFYLFHRDRTWNTVSKKWVGWERKRGGLEELDKWLLGKIEGEGYREHGPGKTFSRIAGDIVALGQIAKVIVLDSDNELLNGTALRLVAKAAHPLNQPTISESDDIVVRGYGVLQPFPIPSKESCRRSFYARMEGWHRRPGGAQHFILQTLQNFFREGTYIGKGIYDVATHERVLANRFPDNQLLSHDKAESGFLRAAFLPDVLVLEEANDNFLAGMNQIGRWLKGDKQTLHWAMPSSPNRQRECVKNPLPFFSRWNLVWPIKKQLSAVSLVSLCAAGWFVPGFSSWWSSLILAGMIAFPYLIVTLNLRRPLSSILGIAQGLVSIFIYLAFSLHRALTILAASLRITFQFPKKGYVSDSFKTMKESEELSVFQKLSRILRILTKSMLKHPNIDWVTASEVKRQKRIYGLAGIYSIMLPSLVVCIALAVGSVMFVKGLAFVLPILGLWFVAPLIVYATSR